MEDRSTLQDEVTEGNAKRFLQFIQANPGCHFRRIRQELSVSIGTAQYHLRLLEKAGRIASNRHGLFKYYFPVGIFQDNEKSILEVLRHETTRDILMFIVEQKNPTQTDIASNIGVSAASISWQVRRLTQLGLIVEARDGKYKRYLLQGDPQQLTSLIKNYYPSLWDRWSDRLAELFLSMSRAAEKEH